MAVFFQIIDKVRGPEKITETPPDIKKELESLKAELKWEKDAKKRFELQRRLKRLERLEMTIETRNVTDVNKKDITEILKWKNADTLKNSDLLTLRKKWIDITNLTLIDNSNPDTEILSTNLKVGDSFTVNFGENKSLRDRTGAGDILPPNVKEITINGVSCERRNYPRPGYYNDAMKPPYQRIYDNYKIIITKLWESTKEDYEANERQWKNERLEDMIDSEWKALSGIKEDMKLEFEAQEEIKIRKKIRDTIGMVREVGSYGTSKPIGETVKVMSELSWTESAALARKIFNPGPATDLLIVIDWWSGTMIKRMIALGYHEGGLKFGRQNPDPSSGFNIWTFQIGWSWTSREDSIKKYESCMNAGIRLAKQYWIDIDYFTLSDPGQRDLISHLWYIESQRWGMRTFDKLRDASLSEDALITLMHYKIQWWIRAIWESVVTQIASTRIDISELS